MNGSTRMVRKPPGGIIIHGYCPRSKTTLSRKKIAEFMEGNHPLGKVQERCGRGGQIRI